MIKRFILLIPTLFLVGCFGAPNMQRYSGPDDMQDNNAVIITDLVQVYSIVFTKFDANYNTKQRTEYRIQGIPEFIVRLGTYRSVVFVTEPGIYFISEARYAAGNTSYQTSLSGLTPEGRVIYGAFEVKPGEVLYIGDIKFNWNKKSGNNLVTTVNNYDQVITDLSASNDYKNLVPKLKQGKFYTIGSRIIMDANGKSRIED